MAKKHAKCDRDSIKIDIFTKNLQKIAQSLGATPSDPHL